MANTYSSRFVSPFAKQFAAFPGEPGDDVDPTILADWSRHQLHGWQVYTHPALNTTQASGPSASILALGHLLDPDAPSADNAAIVKTLAELAVDQDSLEQQLDRLADHWVLFALVGDQFLVYHDACGLKPVFVYAPSDAGFRAVASQPALLAALFGLSRQEELVRFVEHYRNALQWPPYIVPFEQVTQLLPNHRLNLTLGTIERYWPRSRPEPWEGAAAAEAIAKDLYNNVDAATRRGHGWLGLTGGYDSRTLASVVSPLRDRVTLFRMIYRKIPRHDQVLPERAARMLGLDLRVFNETKRGTCAGRDEWNATKRSLLEALDRNVAGMVVDSARRGTVDLAETVGDDLLIHTMGAEIYRAFYTAQMNNNQPTAADLARVMRFDDSPLFLDTYQRWLDGVPAVGIEPGDLLCWECQIGIWGAGMFTYREPLLEIVAPYNSRRLLATAFGVNADERHPPYRLFRRIMARTEPRLTKLPFNTTMPERLRETTAAIAPLPWRVKKKLRLV